MCVGVVGQRIEVMRHLSVSVIIVASSGLLSLAVQAADLPIGGPTPYAVTEFVSNWYLRGDVGYQFSASGGTSDPPFTSSQWGDAGVLDLGIGYRAGWLRGDVTTSWSVQPRFTGDTPGRPGNVTAKFDVVSTLVNVYADLGNWYGFTPYVGGGVGFSWMRQFQFSSATLGGPTDASLDTVDFSWDVTAGVSYQITRQFLIDTSYRFLHVGTPNTSNPPFGTIDYGSMDVHELKAGFRYLID